MMKGSLDPLQTMHHCSRCNFLSHFNLQDSSLTEFDEIPDLLSFPFLFFQRYGMLILNSILSVQNSVENYPLM